MNRYFRMFMLAVCGVQLALAIAFFLRIPLATQLWPFAYTNQMSFVFISSIFAAAAASTLWCILRRENRALAGIALDYMAILIPLSVFVFQMTSSNLDSPLGRFFVICVLGALFGVGLFVWARRQPLRDTRPVPRSLRWIFGFFVIALLIAGGQMVLKVPNILPWSVSVVGSVTYGWMFLGAAAYFLYGILVPGWYNAGGQLAGFLAYDLVLIVPVFGLYQNVTEARLPGLIVYTLVISLSGILAIYYLFINPITAMRWQPRHKPA